MNDTAHRALNPITSPMPPISPLRPKVPLRKCKSRPPSIAAFREYIADLHEDRFPERSHLVETEAPLLGELVRSIGGA